jgi:hypothetical protein
MNALSPGVFWSKVRKGKPNFPRVLSVYMVLVPSTSRSSPPPLRLVPVLFFLAVFHPGPPIPGLSISAIPVKTEHPPAREDPGGLEEVG